MLTVAMLATVSCTFVACDDDDDPKETVKETAQNIALAPINEQYVNNVVIKTYSGLADASEQLVADLEAFEANKTQANLEKACASWKSSRQYWEWSEAFLFGAAAGYGIDPHIDTWPFAKTSFDNYMTKYSPSTNESDAEILSEAIATGQNLTGFHAIEYLIFRDGAARSAEDITDDELWFAIEASNDLYLNSCKLVLAWAGEVSADRAELLEEAEFECDNFGDEFINAGSAGSRWASATAATIQIIEGCQDIIDEVASAKIGAAYNGEDVDYIESPNAYNSIVDFYDNIQSCKHALYGTMDATVTSAKEAATGSVMAYAYLTHTEKALAVSTALETALDEINGDAYGMKKPFVLNYTDASAGEAIAALEALDEALQTLKVAIDPDSAE